MSTPIIHARHAHVPHISHSHPHQKRCDKLVCTQISKTTQECVCVNEPESIVFQGVVLFLIFAVIVIGICIISSIATRPEKRIPFL